MSATPKQPRKKRRIDSQEREANVPPEVLPLVSPNEVKKSSKDPNRGMYPKTNNRPKRNQPCPTFSNAKLLKEASTSQNSEKECAIADISLAEISIQEPGSPQRKTRKVFENQSKENKASSSETKSRKRFSKSKFPVVSLANKIINYFKPSATSSAKKKFKDEAYSSSDDFQEASTSKLSDTLQPETSQTEVPKAEASVSSVDDKNETFFKSFPSAYGLLGEPLKADTGPNYFERLPYHVLEAILCQIPFIDLMKCKQVCSAWNSVIGDEAFMPYKKLYYALKADYSQDHHYHMRHICKSYNLSVVEDCFLVIINYMSKGFGRKPSYDMYDLLSENPKAVEAELVLAERLPEVLTKESKPWSIFATAMLLSETVEDVYSLYQSINKVNSETSLHDITNAMYCIATFLLYFRNAYTINHGLHYRVYTAIYWIENNLPSKGIDGLQTLRVPKGLPGQQSIHSYCETKNSDLTYEQIRILNHCFQPNQIIKIVALAGTGKTTTLVQLAKLHPNVNFLNVMFNKAVCDEAKKRFPPNVTCKTAHSLAYAVYGNQLRFKLSTKIRPHDIVSYLKHNIGTSLQAYTYAKLVLSTIEKYVGSVDREISLEHVPLEFSDVEKIIGSGDRSKILRDALEIWEMMIDRNNKNLRITHDTYLKLYQLSQPKFRKYQLIMVDEAQDCNPAMLDIVMSQKIPVVLVGDPYQQIYGFRGARNAIQSLPATHTYHLTKSFRFGPEIAYIASCSLEVLCANTKQTIVASNKPSYVDGRTEGQYAILARSNVQLFNEAIRLCCMKRYRSNEPTNIQGAFAGGLRGYGFDQMLDIYKLSSSTNDSAPELSDKFISKFRTFKDLCNYAKSVDDNELLAKIDLVKQHSLNIPDFIKIIKEKCSHPMELANVVFSTVHKAKGLEFDTVALTDDFMVTGNFNYRRQPYDSEESNILYVALTRAKRCLLMPDKLMRILLDAQEKFEFPKLASKVLADRTEMECISCHQNFAPHTALVLVRRRIVLSCGHEVPGGPLCVKCATEPLVRPRVTVEPVVMYLDPCSDFAHRSMAALVGPLPGDPPIVRDSFEGFMEDVVYVINLRM